MYFCENCGFECCFRTGEELEEICPNDNEPLALIYEVDDEYFRVELPALKIVI